jgi:hypothetical protein
MCRDISVESMEFEAGNNAEYVVSVPLCETHALEAEETGYDFREKYGEQIEEALCESWRSQADALVDQAKYEETHPTEDTP